MKNGKVPTLEQKKIMKAHGLNPDSWKWRSGCKPQGDRASS